MRDEKAKKVVKGAYWGCADGLALGFLALLFVAQQLPSCGEPTLSLQRFVNLDLLFFLTIGISGLDGAIIGGIIAARTK